MSSLFRSFRASRSLALSVQKTAALSSYAPRLSSFEERWLKLSQAEKEQIAAEYESLQKADWKNLTIDQKKILYTISYGVPERKDPKEGRKIFATTIALVGVAAGLFAFIRSFANPPPKTTYNKEWQDASKEILRNQKANPISGISSKPATSKDEEGSGED